MGTETGLKYILKHVNRFYDMCQSDGTCTRMLPDVMKYRGGHILAERDNSLNVAVIDHADKGVKKKQLSQVNQWTTRVLTLFLVSLRVKRVPLELKFLIGYMVMRLPLFLIETTLFLYFHLTILVTLTTIIGI